jgi:KDO2-lipid IV(A) lauroyltransferase
MYYIVYGLFYLLSLLPFRVMYVLSDGVFLLVYYVAGYRRKLVMEHLTHTFPEKSEAEKEKIARQFYRNFCDVWVEMIKTITMTREEAARRMECDFAIFQKWHAEGKTMQLVGGHFINWEYLPVCIPSFQPFIAIAIFMPLSNKVLNRLVYNMRSRFGLVLMGAGNMQKEMRGWQNRQYMMIVGADQSPSNPGEAFWLYYCNQPAGFVSGPWKRAVRQNQPYGYLKIRKISRGRYSFKASVFEENPSAFTPAALAKRYVAMLEDEIHEAPELYLWTHNRWKRKWKPEYEKQWIDDKPPPKV